MKNAKSCGANRRRLNKEPEPTLQIKSVRTTAGCIVAQEGSIVRSVVIEDVPRVLPIGGVISNVQLVKRYAVYVDHVYVYLIQLRRRRNLKLCSICALFFLFIFIISHVECLSVHHNAMINRVTKRL